MVLHPIYTLMTHICFRQPLKSTHVLNCPLNIYAWILNRHLKPNVSRAELPSFSNLTCSGAHHLSYWQLFTSITQSFPIPFFLPSNQKEHHLDLPSKYVHNLTAFHPFTTSALVSTTIISHLAYFSGPQTSLLHSALVPFNLFIV